MGARRFPKPFEPLQKLQLAVSSDRFVCGVEVSVALASRTRVSLFVQSFCFPSVFTIDFMIKFISVCISSVRIVFR